MSDLYNRDYFYRRIREKRNIRLRFYSIALVMGHVLTILSTILLQPLITITLFLGLIYLTINWDSNEKSIIEENDFEKEIFSFFQKEIKADEFLTSGDEDLRNYAKRYLKLNR